MMARLLGLNAADVERINRVVRTVESVPWKSASSPVAKPRPYKLRLAYANTSAIAAGGAGWFDWMQSTAAASTETNAAPHLLFSGWDWFGTSLSTGEKALIFAPHPTPKNYFLKPGVTPKLLQWAQVNSTATTRVASGSGSTASLFVRVSPCSNSEGHGLETNTTYIVTLPTRSTSLLNADVDAVVGLVPDGASYFALAGQNAIRSYMFSDGAVNTSDLTAGGPIAWQNSNWGHRGINDIVERGTSGFNTYATAKIVRPGLYWITAGGGVAISSMTEADGISVMRLSVRRQNGPGGSWDILPGCECKISVTPTSTGDLTPPNHQAAQFKTAGLSCLYATTATTDVLGVFRDFLSGSTNAGWQPEHWIITNISNRTQ